MLALAPCPTHVSRALTESPAVLRLKLLEATFDATRAVSEDKRRSAHHLIVALRRAIAEKPSLTFADVVAKLKTCDDIDRDGAGEKWDELKKSMLKNALADLARIRARG